MECFGISKRKWLAFGIFSAIVPAYLMLIFILGMGPELAGVSLFVFLLIMAAVVITDKILEWACRRFGISIRKRYLAAMLFALALILGGYFFPHPPVIGGLLKAPDPMEPYRTLASEIGIALLTLAAYIISDFIAGRFCPTERKEKKRPASKKR